MELLEALVERWAAQNPPSEVIAGGVGRVGGEVEPRQFHLAVHPDAGLLQVAVVLVVLPREHTGFPGLRFFTHARFIVKIFFHSLLS
jgi:hypothetical protein